MTLRELALSRTRETNLSTKLRYSIFLAYFLEGNNESLGKLQEHLQEQSHVLQNRKHKVIDNNSICAKISSEKQWSHHVTISCACVALLPKKTKMKMLNVLAEQNCRRKKMF